MTTHQSDACASGLMPDYSRAGVVLCRTGMYHCAAQDVILSADTLQMVPIPKNAQILNIQIMAKKAAGTLDLAGCTGCHVGDGASPTRFFDDASLGGTTQHELFHSGKFAAVGYTYDEGNDTIDIAFTKLATVMETDTVIIMNVFYKMAGSISDEDFQEENAVGA